VKRPDSRKKKAACIAFGLAIYFIHIVIVDAKAADRRVADCIG
jgi:hypothetical protein